MHLEKESIEGKSFADASVFKASSQEVAKWLVKESHKKSIIIFNENIKCITNETC